MIPFPNILERRKNLLMLGWLNDPSITSYKVLVQDTLDKAYGNFNGVGGAPGPQQAFDRIMRGDIRVTSTIQRRGNILSSDITRGQTRLIYDPNELIGTVTDAPSDSQMCYLRTQVTTSAMPTYPALDPTSMSSILVIPPYDFRSILQPSLPLYGTAPNLATAIVGNPPPSDAMRVHIPYFVDSVYLTNYGAGTLLYSTGDGLPLVSVASGSTFQLASGSNDLIFCSNGANPVFSAIITIISGLR